MLNRMLKRFSLMKIMENGSIQRFENSIVDTNEGELTPLVALDDNNCNIPQNFPRTLGALKSLEMESVNSLLQAYGLPLNRHLNQRRKSLAWFIGLIFFGAYE